MVFSQFLNRFGLSNRKLTGTLKSILDWPRKLSMKVGAGKTGKGSLSDSKLCFQLLMDISSCHLYLSQYLSIVSSQFACYTTVPNSTVARLLLFYNAWLSSCVWSPVNLPSFRPRPRVRTTSTLSVFNLGSNHHPCVEHTPLIVLPEPPNYTCSFDKTNFCLHCFVVLGSLWALHHFNSPTFPPILLLSDYRYIEVQPNMPISLSRCMWAH